MIRCQAFSLILLPLLACAPVFAAEPVIPSDPAPRWWKGNTHTHTFWSDGNDFPEMVADWYRESGYNFLVLTDHNILSRGEKWMPIADIDTRSRGSAYEKYLDRFGATWVEARGEGSSLEIRLKPLREVRALFEQRGEFIMIEGEEISDGWEGRPIHINAVNLAELATPRHGETVEQTIRNNLLAVMQQADEAGRPILTHINHPNFGWGITAEEIAGVVEAEFFEIYNGHTGVRNNGDENHASLERVWDIVNTLRIAEFGAPPILGVATDDSHSYHGHSLVSITGRAWVCVRATHLTPDTIVRAMKAGDFYASSGVELESVDFDTEARRLDIRIAGAPGARYTTRFIGSRRGVDLASEPIVDEEGASLPVTRAYSPRVGEILDEQEGPAPSYTFRGDELYVRAVVVSSLEPERPTKEMLRRTAWTQPVGWRPAD
ncbi:MAG TPA: hypothetical protein DEB57_00365 [Microbacterium sp.]|nr:hypothetical protein [Microbacterium sp.]